MEVDPVCGMEIDPEKGECTAKYEGKTYYFCCDDCKEAFVEDPEAYLFDIEELDEDEDMQVDME